MIRFLIRFPLYRGLGILFFVAGALHFTAPRLAGQILGDDPTFDVWAPRPARATLVIEEAEVGMDFASRGQSGAYFRMDSASAVDATEADVLTLHYRMDVAVPWISFGIQDNTGAWHFEYVENVPAGESMIVIPLNELEIDPTQVTGYDAWVSAVDFDGQVYRLKGSFRFILAEPAIHVRAGDEVAFLEMMRTPNVGEDPQVFYVHGDANLDERIDIIGRSGDEIHFLDDVQVVDEVQTQGDWSDDRGVVNIVDCSDLFITGLRARNTYQYTANPVQGDEQSSTALNISRSQNIRIEGAELEGSGRCVVWIHGGSTVEALNMTIHAYYFCVGVGASNVSFTNLVANQFNPVATGDKHSTFWVSSSMRSTATNELHRETEISLLDTDINLRTGRAIVSGNGAYDAHSYVTFTGTTQIDATDHSLGKALGWVNFHSNYHAFSVFVMGSYFPPTKDLVQPTDDGEFGRFIVNTFQGGGRPSPLAPTAYCDDSGICVTSDEVLGVDQPIDLVHGGLSAQWLPINPTQLATAENDDLQVAYSAAYEAVILNVAVRNIDMSQATHLRIRSKSQQAGSHTMRVSFVNEANQQLNPVLFSVTDQWQSHTIALSDYVRRNADKIILVSHGNDQDVTLDVAEISILAND